MITTYIEFQYPGILVQETSSQKVTCRDMIPKMPEGAIAYRFFDRQEIESDGERLKGKAQNTSPWIYVGARKMSVEDVEREMPDERILIENMKCNEIDHIAFTKHGQALQLYEGDIVVDTPLALPAASKALLAENPDLGYLPGRNLDI